MTRFIETLLEMTSATLDCTSIQKMEREGFSRASTAPR
jgi:hypothetical protein